LKKGGGKNAVQEKKKIEQGHEVRGGRQKGGKRKQVCHRSQGKDGTTRISSPRKMRLGGKGGRKKGVTHVIIQTFSRKKKRKNAPEGGVKLLGKAVGKISKDRRH